MSVLVIAEIFQSLCVFRFNSHIWLSDGVCFHWDFFAKASLAIELDNTTKNWGTVLVIAEIFQNFCFFRFKSHFWLSDGVCFYSDFFCKSQSCYWTCQYHQKFRALASWLVACWFPHSFCFSPVDNSIYSRSFRDMLEGSKKFFQTMVSLTLWFLHYSSRHIVIPSTSSAMFWLFKIANIILYNFQLVSELLKFRTIFFWDS